MRRNSVMTWRELRHIFREWPILVVWELYQGLCDAEEKGYY